MKQKCEHLDYVYMYDSRRFNEKRTNDDFDFSTLSKSMICGVVITPEGRDEFLAVSTFAASVDRLKRTTPLNGKRVVDGT